ncbi:MAG TPA: hypothetical protein VK162_24820 [Streptosporangiaceae bacterium]|nr:hypothetical protein [Streptosporangiaceae bacterium]
MRRKTFDALATTVGLVLAVILLAAGGLMMWGHSFVDSQVHNQLAAQKIYFPPNGSPAIKAPEFAAMHQYAGQLMTNGAQAEVYADHFIANHLTKIGGGQTYAQLSARALAHPKNTALAGQVDAMFKGTTLRGMLLNAYAFWKMGELAFWGAIVSFIGAGLLLILAGLGYAHLRRVSPTAEVFPHLTEKVPAGRA